MKVLRRATPVFLSLLLVVTACGGGETSETSTTAGQGSDTTAPSSDTTAPSSDTTAASGEPLIVGMAAGFTGVLEGLNAPAHVALEIAIDELNAAGGILGRPVELVTADTQSDINQGARAGQEVIQAGAEVVFVDPDFNFGGGAAREAQTAGLVSVSVGAGSPKFGVEGIGDKAFTMGMSGVSDGAIAAEWAYEELGHRTAWLLIDDVTDYNQDECRGFQQRWEELGGEILGSDTFKNSDPSIAPQVSRISALAEQPDVISLCSFPPGMTVAMKQLRDAGINSLAVSNSANDGDYWYKDSIPGLSDFCFVTTASIWGNDPSEEVNDFVELFIETTGEQPQAGYAYFAYAGMHMVAAAIEEAGTTDGAAVAEVLESYTNEPIAGIEVSFSDELHIDTLREARIMCIQDGEHEVSAVRAAEELPPLFEE